MESDLPHSCDTQHPDSSDRKNRTKKKPKEARYPGGEGMRHGGCRRWTSNAKEGQGLTGEKVLLQLYPYQKAGHGGVSL